ncbi:MAG: response regulator [bacterium]|nr:response regulator [bacterium]
MRSKIVNILLLLLISVFSTICIARQQVVFEHLTIEDGLSQNSVNSILQDERGFLWFGTTLGLNKYDGHNLTIYTHNAFDLSTLSDNWITCIYEDRGGILWIGTKDGGLNKFDRTEGVFKQYLSEPGNRNGISSNKIVSIHEDKQGYLWIATEDAGLNKFDLEKDVFQYITAESGAPNSLSSNNILSVFQDIENDILWIGTDGAGLDRYNILTGECINYRNETGNINSLSDNTVKSILMDSHGYLWAGTENGGLNKIDLETGSFIHYTHDPEDPSTLSDNDINTIFEDSKGDIWIGTNYQGLNRFDNKGGFRIFLQDPDVPGSISSNSVLVIIEDRSGNIWYGTESGGVNKYCRSKLKFGLIKHVPDNLNSLSIDGIWTIFQHEDEVLWVGTYGGGLNRIDRENNVFKHYLHDPNDPESLSDNVVNCIVRENERFMWIGTDNGLNRFDIRNESFEVFRNIPDDSTSLPHNDITNISIEDTGNLWISTWGGGLVYYDRSRNIFQRRISDPADPSSLHREKIASIFMDEDNVLWICSNAGGLVRYNINEGTYKRYRSDPDNPKSISNNKVNIIRTFRKTGRYLIGTFGGGLNIFDPETEEFDHITMQDGLPDNMIYGILEDNDGKFWISTNNGLVNLDVEDLSMSVFSADNGLQSDEFNAGAFFKNSKGEMFFGGIKGLNFFHPDSISRNNYIPQVEIISLNVFNHIYLPDIDFSIENPIELLYSNNHISLEFVSLDFTNPEKNKYAYMLEDVDKDWVYSNFRFANYSNLDPGDYTFRVKGSSSDGIWNEEGTSLKIKIVPPFWLTSWFRFSTVLFVIGMVIIAYKVKTRKIRQQRVILEDLVHTRTKDLQEKQVELERARGELEVRVDERTKELIEKNLELEKEISERMRFENELRISEEEYRTLTENVNIGIYRRTKGADGTVIKINPAMVEMFGYPSIEDFLNLQIKDLYDDPEDLIRFNERMEMVGYARGEELLYKRKDGSTFVGAVTVVAVRNEEGEILYFDGVIEDITERKRSEAVRKTLEEQLFQSQKLESIGRLAGGIAHDFNNILTGVMGFAEILKMKFKDRSVVEGHAADVIFTGAERAAELTKQLLGFARAGKYYPVPVNLNVIIQDMVRVSEKIFEKNVKVVFDFEEKLNTVEADKNQLEQVVTNLIINAKDAMPNGGELIFRTENVEVKEDFSKKYPEFKPGKYVRTTFTDTGIGIPKDIMDHIFEPFFTTKEEGKGTGLGLSMVYGIIKNHYGYIYVETRKGKGTSFIIYLPVTDKTVVEKKDKSTVLQGNETILIIDDEENVRSLVKKQLESLGYDVLLAPDGIAGIEIFKKNKKNIDLVLLDMVMPNLSGKETMKLLNQEDKGVKIVVISGYSKEIVSGTGSEMDVLKFIQKPFKISDISSVLSEIFNK